LASDGALVSSEPSRIGEPAALAAVRARIARRFGLVPSFFMMASVEPPIVESMFMMAEFTYFDAPLPALFKERLFTYVSRFCAVPYCMARHCAFLVGCGNVSGDPGADGISMPEAVALLKTPFPDAAGRDEVLLALRAVPDAVERWPDPRSALSETVLLAAAVVFVMPLEHRPLLAELERVLGARYYNYLMLFLGFIRFAHFWTESHPQLRVEDDIDQLLSEQRALAEWVTSYSAQVEREVAQAKAELRELELLRARAAQSERDVDDLRKEVTARTQDAQVALAESRAKATYMATLGHELRTPLNAVVGYTELLEAGLGGALDDKGLMYLARIKATARQQQQIIEEILSFARLEGGRETVRTEVISMDALLAELHAVIMPLAEGRGLTLTTTVGNAPARFTADAGKVRQILLNLLGNAVKFTPAGSVELSVVVAHDALVFSVSDTGPGIRPEDRERIFEPFTQLDQGRTREYGGTGLGLAITKRLVHLLDGDIRAHARDGGGATFVVALPYQRVIGAE
jgi:signal transduction histidine kinase